MKLAMRFGRSGNLKASSSFAALVATAMVAATVTPALAQEAPYDEAFDPLGDDTTTELRDPSRLVIAVNKQFLLSSDGSVAVFMIDTPSNGDSPLGIWSSDSGFQQVGVDGQRLYAFALSADGSVIGGGIQPIEGFGIEAMRYTAEGGIERLGWLNDATTGYSYVLAMSANGRVMAGTSTYSANGFVSHAFRWTDDDGMEDLGTLDGGISVALAMSADGTVIVGASNGRAFRWEDDTGMESLGVLVEGSYEGALGISADGNVIFGISDGGERDTTFRWTEAGGMVDIGNPADYSTWGNAMSADGSTIVGDYRPSAFDTSRAFSWTETGGLIDLGTLGGSYSTAGAVSGDGSVIVGSSRIDNQSGEFHAYRWTAEDGMVDLGTLGGYSSIATNVSEDGSTVVGHYYIGRILRPFIYRTRMQDFTNLLASFGGIAEESELAVAAPRERLRQIEKPGCTGGGKIVCLGLGGYSWSGGARLQTGARAKEQAISLFAGVSPHRLVTLGITHSWANNDMAGPRTTLHDNRAWSGWLNLGDSAKLTGPNLNGWYAKSHDDFALDRTAGIPDVESASGSSKLRGTSYGIGASYGIALNDKWAFAPSGSVARVRLHRDAYVEAASDYPASFDALKAEETRITGGATVSGIIGLGILRLSAEAEHFGDIDQLTVSGTSEIPGSEAFALESSLDRHATRGRFAAGYTIPVGAAQFGVTGYAATAEYGSTWQLGAMTYAGMAF